MGEGLQVQAAGHELVTIPDPGSVLSGHRLSEPAADHFGSFGL